MSPLSFRFGTVGSPKSTPARPGGSIGAILRLHELGLSTLELGWVQSVRVSEKTCQEIRATGQENGVAISVHAPYFINLNADEQEWPKSRKRLMDSAYYGYLAGATDIIFHPGSYFERDPALVLTTAIPRLAGCVEELQAGDVNVTLRPEVMGKQAMLGSLQDVLSMSREMPGVLPGLDFAHLHARAGDGSMNTYEEWMQALEAYGAALGGEALKHLHIHLSGIAYGPKGEKEHLPMDESDLDLQAILRALKAQGCAGRILNESPNLEEDALKYQYDWIELSGESPG